MNESTKKIKEMIKSFNETFDISINLEGDEVNSLKIDKLKNGGEEFVNKLFDIFGTIISNSDTDYELIYNKDKGLAIAKKVVNIDYLIED